jgi:acetyl-CoA C-acetyltransferase
MEKVYILSTRRTAIGSFGGGLKTLSASELGSIAVKASLEAAGVESGAVSELIMGNVLGAGQGMGPGRQTAIKSGLPVEVPGYSINMLCGSGMKAVMTGAGDIQLGRAEIVAAVGSESMSQAPFYLSWANRFGQKLGSQNLEDAMLLDGLTDVFNQYHMGMTAENIARSHHISRKEQDEFALESQRRTAAAMDAGRFAEEIVPVVIPGRKGETRIDRDEHPRPETTLEALGRLRPAFTPDGSVTAGNASGINDGAAAVILAGEAAAAARGLTPIAELIGYEQAGVDPAYMGLGPVPAIQSVLSRTGLTLRDMERIELNEAFAAQSLGVLRDLSAQYGESTERLIDRCNVNGGAIALGHPIGASGARIITTLLYELQRSGKELGLASLCIGGGMGVACIVKMV